MTKQITLEEALKLVVLQKDTDGNWRVLTVKGNCNTVAGWCGIVEGNCGTVEGNCVRVEGNCGIVDGNCGIVKGNCDTVEGKVLKTINGRKWHYEETPREKFEKLLKESGNQELIDAFNQLEDN